MSMLTPVTATTPNEINNPGTMATEQQYLGLGAGDWTTPEQANQWAAYQNNYQNQLSQYNQQQQLAGNTAQAQAYIQPAMQGLQNQYQNAQTSAMNNAAGRFGGINNSYMNDQSYNNSYGLGQGMASLQNQFIGDLGNLNNMSAQQGIAAGQLAINQQLANQQKPTYMLNGQIYPDVNSYNAALKQATTIPQQPSEMW